MWEVDFTGIGVEDVTMLAAGGMVVADEGKVAKVSGEKKVDLCNAEDVFYGVIRKFDEGGGVVALTRKGFKEVSYSGTITPGRKELVANGNGGVKAPAVGVQALLITGVEENNNAMLWTAKAYGVIDHDIRVQLKDPGGNDKALSIDVVGKDIIVNLATGVAGAITSTAAEIIAAIATSAAASLVTAEDSGESNGTGIVTAEALTALAGGVDPTIGKYYQIVSVDSNAGTLILDLG
ncbi:MAG: hypothetical protein HY739_12960 [Desulfobacterales bacterium]|nr:hypothetical protein [Desulfobacterales bacterium]